MDFWPLRELDPEFYMRAPKLQIGKHIRYSDGRWVYEADTVTGIDIEVKCDCGKVHKIHLGAGLYCEPPRQEEVVDAEILEEVINEDAGGSSTRQDKGELSRVWGEDGTPDGR